MQGEKIYSLTQEQMDMEDDWTLAALDQLLEQIKQRSVESADASFAADEE